MQLELPPVSVHWTNADPPCTLNCSAAAQVAGAVHNQCMTCIPRTKRLHVMLSDEEQKMVEALADIRGQSVSDWTRFMIREAAKRQLPKRKRKR